MSTAKSTSLVQASRKKIFFAALTTISASSLLVVIAACGGGTTPAGDAKNPGSSSSGDGTSGAMASSGASDPGASSGGASGGSTTTTALGDGGDLQGAKLGSATHTEVATKGDAGPHAGPGHSSEPGRRREDIQTIVMARRDDARACYDKGLKDHPGIEGDLTVRFLIDPQGVVTEASVDTTKSTILEPGVGQCVSDLIKKIQFAPSKLGFETRASYPYNFHPKTFGKGDGGAK